MAFIREGLDAHVKDYIDQRIHSSFTQFNPLFYFLGLSKPDSRNNLGRPKTGAVFTGARMTTAQVEELNGSKEHQFRYVKAEPNDGAAVTFGGATPTATDFAEDNFGTAETRWTHIMEPAKLRKHSLEMARGDTAIRAITDDSLDPVWERFVKRINAGFWTGTRTSAQQDQRVWGDFLGLQHTLTKDNVYGRVDRAVETNLNPVVIDASSDLKTSVIDLTLSRKINSGFTTEGSTDIAGLAGKDENGTGATCWITTSNLWQELANQADGRFQIFTNGIPDSGMGGFKRPVIAFDNVYYTWDPTCPSGEMYGLNLETWMIEIQRGHNFVWGGWQDKAKTEEGGAYYLWGHFDVMLRMTCRKPWLNCKITNLTAA